jgi:TnpA family transposase
LNEFEKQKSQQTLTLAVNLDFDEYMKGRQKTVTESYKEVLPLLIAKSLDGVRFEQGKLSISPLESEIPEEAKSISDKLYNMLPRVKLTDILVEVNSWIGFEKYFTHLYTGKEAPDTRLLLTAILGDGINMSQSRMADATPGISRDGLINLSKWYIREETYAKAIAEVTNMQYSHPFSSHWGDGTSSSSDAQNYPIKDPRAKVGDVNVKYSQKSTLNYYTHISDQYAPFYTRVIRSTLRDSPYVLDGLLNHESDLRIEEHHTDTGGFSDQVFGLCHLLGFRFSPRIRDLHDLKIYHFGEKESYPELKELMGDQINVTRLKVHWNDILRLAASIRSGKVTASTMLKKLGSYPRQNSLGWALREIGRIERSLFILNWIKDPQLRRKTTLALNKGEARNNLARDVHHSGLGKIQDHSWERQLHRASGLCLVTGCIILWNTVYLAKAVETLKRDGNAMVIKYLQYVSPVGWEHINLGGEYFWNMDQKTTWDNLRSLRN